LSKTLNKLGRGAAVGVVAKALTEATGFLIGLLLARKPSGTRSMCTLSGQFSETGHRWSSILLLELLRVNPLLLGSYNRRASELLCLS